MGTQEQTLYLRLADGTLAEARALDLANAEKLRRAAADGGARGKPVRIRIASDQDTAGHAMAADTVEISIEVGDDVAGHTLTLRLPSPDAARTFQKRLLVSGVLAATLLAGAAGAQLAGQHATTRSVTGPASGPAITAPVRAPSSVNPVLRYQPSGVNLDRAAGDENVAAPSSDDSSAVQRVISEPEPR